MRNLIVSIGLITAFAVLTLTGCSNPEADVKQDSGNAQLAELTVSAGTLDPVFSPTTTEYNLSVANSVASIQVAAKAADSGATVKITPAQPAPLAVGTGNTVVVTVTAANGTGKTYTVHVTRAAASSSNADLASLSVSKGSLNVSFNPAVTAYTVTVAYYVSSLSVSALPADSGATVSISPAQPTALSVGANTVTATVTAKDNTKKTYTVTITRQNPPPTVDLTGYRIVAGGSGGLKILNVSNPERPTVKGSCLTGNSYTNALSVATSGNYAYVCDSNACLVVVDISNLAAPVVVSKYSTNLSQADSVVVRGDYAYVSRSYFNTVSVINISDPSNPVLVKTVTLAAGCYIQSMTLNGDHLYAATVPGLMILDLTDPTTPVIAGSCATTRTANKIKISGNYAFIAASQAGLVIADISDPAHPSITGTYSTAGQVDSVELNGKYAYVTGYKTPLTIIDVSSPSSPSFVSKYTGVNAGLSVLAVGDFAYFETGYNIVEIVNLTNPAQPCAFRRNATILGNYGARSGNYVYVGGRSAGLCVVDVSNPDYAAAVKQVATTLEANHIVINGTTAFVSVSSGSTTSTYVDIIDITNPAAASKTDTVITDNEVNALAVGGDILYMVEYKKLELYSISGKKNLYPSLGLTDPSAIAVNGNYAFIGDGSSGLVIADVSNSAAITRVGSCSVGGWASSVAIKGNYAYVSVNNTGLAVVDISNPSKPILVTTNTIATNPGKVIVSGSIAWVDNNQSDLIALDITNPSNPTLLGKDTLHSVLTFMDFAINDSRAFLFDGCQGFFTVDISDPTNMYNMLAISGHY